MYVTIIVIVDANQYRACRILSVCHVSKKETDLSLIFAKQTGKRPNSFHSLLSTTCYDMDVPSSWTTVSCNSGYFVKAMYTRSSNSFFDWQKLRCCKYDNNDIEPYGNQYVHSVARNEWAFVRYDHPSESVEFQVENDEFVA